MISKVAPYRLSSSPMYANSANSVSQQTFKGSNDTPHVHSAPHTSSSIGSKLRRLGMMLGLGGAMVTSAGCPPTGAPPSAIDEALINTYTSAGFNVSGNMDNIDYQQDGRTAVHKEKYTEPDANTGEKKYKVTTTNLVTGDTDSTPTYETWTKDPNTGELTRTDGVGTRIIKVDPNTKEIYEITPDGFTTSTVEKVGEGAINTKGKDGGVNKLREFKIDGNFVYEEVEHAGQRAKRLLTDAPDASLNKLWQKVAKAV